MSIIKSRHIWILYILLMAFVLPVYGLDVPNGSVTKYVYNAIGEKLRVIHQTAVPNITVAIGSIKELAPSEIQYKDSTDYLLGGSLTLKNGRIDKFQFEEGYCQAVTYDAIKNNFNFCYYDKDHLGNIRQVSRFIKNNNKGTVVQSMNYYPFGAQFCNGVADSGIQPYKYNGKEFDQMHGLNTYDYGARQYNPVTGRWDRMDPLAEKDKPTSPYVFCANNPVNRVDKDGRIWDTVIDLAFVAYDAAEATYQYCTTGHVSNTTKTALGADALAAAVPGLTGTGLAVRAGEKAVSKSANITKVAKKTLQSASNGSRTEKLHKSAEIGQEAHRQIEKELSEAFGAIPEVKVDLPKRTVRKDAQMPDGKYVIIKPDTPSGHKAAKGRQNLMEKNGKETITIFYNPQNPAYQPGSPSYIGPIK